MPHFMIVLILYITLLNLSWIKRNVYFFRNMELLNTGEYFFLAHLEHLVVTAFLLVFSL